MSELKMERLMGVKEDGSEVLGKLLYYSLSSVLIDRDTLAEICENMSLPVKLGARLGAVDAFKSATGDIYERLVKKEHGEVRVSKVYCRDNKKSDETYSRELVLETLGDTTNRYKKLANICYDREYERFSYSVESYEPDIDAYKQCDKASDLFELYKQCAGRNQIETITDGFLNYMEALKICRGHIFFIPRKNMHFLDIFEDFIEMISRHNQRDGQVTVNSMFVVDDAKQRDKMTAEFYNTTRKEIETYTEKLEHLITSGNQSQAILDRWLQKIGRLEEKKRHYEDILKRELDDLDDQYGTLKFLAQELELRANKARMAKCA